MSLKILHTGDWHLGKKLFKTSRLPEQQIFLNELKQIIISKNIDALIIAGDIFDTPYPPSDAIRLLSDFLYEVTDNNKCQVYFISGNHDSGRFLETSSPFYKNRNIHVVGEIRNRSPEDFVFTIRSEKATASLFMLPFFRSFDLITLGKSHFPELESLREDSISEYLLMVLKKLFRQYSDNKQDMAKILMTHHLFAGYEASESEQGVGLSGLDHIPLSILSETFDYVALGHLHKKQVLSKENPIVVYPGSPIPFRFSETSKKWLSLIEIDNQNEVQQSFVELSTYRKILKIKTDYATLEEKLDEIKKEKSANGLNTLLEVSVCLKEPTPGIADSIREKLKDYPIELVSFNSFIENQTEEKKTVTQFQHLSTEELFKKFYNIKYGDDCPDDIFSEFTSILSEFRNQFQKKGLR